MDPQAIRANNERNRKINDFNSSLMNYYCMRTYDFGENDLPPEFWDELLPEFAQTMYPTYIANENPWELAWPRYIEESWSTSKHPVFTIKWMQYGKKLITGHTNGEIHIWNGVTLKFDTVNSVHEDGIKAMKWVKDHEWLVTADK